jgi:hypothetical protein
LQADDDALSLHGILAEWRHPGAALFVLAQTRWRLRIVGRISILDAAASPFANARMAKESFGKKLRGCWRVSAARRS